MFVHTRYTTDVALPHRPGQSLEDYKADELRAIALVCAREFSRNYDDQQDLASQALLAALQYKGVILFPKQFLRTTIRNLVIDRRRSLASRELTGCDWAEESTDDATTAQDPGDPFPYLFIADTLNRMERELTSAERQCYQLFRKGYEQRDLPGLLKVSRQAVSQIIASLRRKYRAAEDADAS